VIRPVEKSDEPFLWETLYHALYVPEGSPPFPREIVNEPEIAKYVSGWGKSGDLGFVLIDEASRLPVGAVWARLFESKSPGYGYVDDTIPELSIALLPGYRNLGLGTQLLRHMLEEAAGQFSGLSLSVSSENPARRLYERLGFSIIEVNGSSLKMLLKFRHRETIVYGE
jgi:ribosomal protein S18 acetylase RimI-like enzyme